MLPQVWQQKSFMSGGLSYGGIGLPAHSQAQAYDGKPSQSRGWLVSGLFAVFVHGLGHIEVMLEGR